MNNVDIIVLTCCKNNMVYKCLQSLEQCDKSKIRTLIVCYTGKNDTDIDKLSAAMQQTGLSTKLVEDKYNFAINNNKIVNSYVQADAVLFLNDDVVLQNDAISTCLNVLSCPAIGTVGIKLLYQNGTIQHAGIFFQEKDQQFKGVGHLLFMQQDRPLKMIFTAGNTGAFLMTKTQLFKKLGGFNEQFQNCFEDVHYCWKVMNAGKINCTCCNMSAIHYESNTRGKNNFCRNDMILLNKCYYQMRNELASYNGIVNGAIIA